MQPIWEVALQLLFYGSPVIYVITACRRASSELVAFNPIAVVLTQMAPRA